MVSKTLNIDFKGTRFLESYLKYIPHNIVKKSEMLS